MLASVISAFGRPWVRRTLLLFAGALVVFGIGLLVFQVLPDHFAPRRAPGFGIAEEAKARMRRLLRTASPPQVWHDPRPMSKPC